MGTLLGMQMGMLMGMLLGMLLEVSVSGNAGLFLSPVLNCGSVSRPPLPPASTKHTYISCLRFLLFALTEC